MPVMPERSPRASIAMPIGHLHRAAWYRRRAPLEFVPWLSCSHQRPAGSAPSIQSDGLPRFPLPDGCPNRPHGRSTRYRRPSVQQHRNPAACFDREIGAGYHRTLARVSCIMIKRRHVETREPAHTEQIFWPFAAAGHRPVCMWSGAARERVCERVARQVCHGCALRPTSRMKV